MTASETIAGTVTKARAGGRGFLLENEGLEIIAELGFNTPRWHFVAGSQDFNGPLLPGSRVVIKVVSPDIQHKSEYHAVQVIDNSLEVINQTIKTMRSSLETYKLEGFLLCEFIEHKNAMGHELLLGLRNTRDFGPVISLGVGGIYAEHISSAFEEGRALSVFVPDVFPEVTIASALNHLAIVPLITGQLRSQKSEIDKQTLLSTLQLLLKNAALLASLGISEFEMNPLVISAGRLIALDVLIKLGPEASARMAPARPIHKIENLLKPKRIGIVGVSEKLNPGRIILNNLLRDNFPRQNIFVIKPSASEIAGCRCYPDVASLPERLDLLVLAISADHVPQTVLQVIEHKKAESLLVIPAGLEEKKGAQELVEQMLAALWKSRETSWQGPVMNGGNCVGIRSEPGRYDTFFIPEYKLPLSGKPSAPIAVISQSGAFTVARASANAGLFNPRYLISIGNQTDLTVGDYLEHLKNESDIELFAVYVEGFKPGDGLRFLRAAHEITQSGRSVMLYAAGRTPAGSQAMASHTASVAGDYLITRELCNMANVILVESSADFDDLLRLFAFLREKKVAGLRLGAISNAGFDCVAVADNVRKFSIQPFSDSTNRKLSEIFATARLSSILDVHNPLDVSPSADDGVFSAALEAVLADEVIDVAVLADVPITPALNTLPAGFGHKEDFSAASNSIVMQTRALKHKYEKAWVGSIDGGVLYDPMAQYLLESGVPVFRSIDRAVRLFEIYCAERLRIQQK